MKKIRNLLNILSMPILFLMFFVNVSGFGQAAFNEYGTSIIMVTVFFLIYLINLRKIPSKINFCFLLLILYSIIMTIIGEDWKNFVISIFSVASIALFVKTDYSDENLLKSFYLTGILAVIILISYNHWGKLGGWNTNTIGMGCTIGCCCFGLLDYILKSKTTKLINLIFIIISIYELFIIENRNAILIFITFLIIIKFAYKIKLRGKKVICASLIFSPMIVTNIFIKLKEMEFFKWLANISDEIFQKSTVMSGREWFWETSKAYIGDNWIFGTGKSLYNMHIYAHNMYYPAVYSYGIIGYLLYSLLIYIICKFIIENTNDFISFGCVAIATANFIGQIMENVLFTANFATYLPYVFLSIALGRTLKFRKEERNGNDNNFYSDL